MTKQLTYIIIFIAASFISLRGTGSDKKNVSSDAECKSVVTIHGSSNVNRFYFTNDKVYIQNEAGNFVNENFIRIPVETFKASNSKMLADFHDMMNAEDHPFIHIEIEPGRTADFDETSGLTRFRSVISIAGKSNQYVIPGEITSCDISGYMLKGNLMLKLTDFDIDPPRKVLGAVKVNDEVFINFVFRIPSEGVLSEEIP